MEPRATNRSNQFFPLHSTKPCVRHCIGTANLSSKGAFVATWRGPPPGKEAVKWCSYLVMVFFFHFNQQFHVKVINVISVVARCVNFLERHTIIVPLNRKLTDRFSRSPVLIWRRVGSSVECPLE